MLSGQCIRTEGPGHEMVLVGASIDIWSLWRPILRGVRPGHVMIPVGASIDAWGRRRPISRVARLSKAESNLIPQRDPRSRSQCRQ